MLDFELPPRVERGYITAPSNPWRGTGGLALALRLCRDGADGLAGHMRRVPEDYVAVAVRLQDRQEVRTVLCPCGGAQEVRAGLVECSCSRWFAADEGGVWAIRLPEAE